MTELGLSSSHWGDTFVQVGFDYRWHLPGSPLVFRTLDINHRFGQIRANIALEAYESSPGTLALETGGSLVRVYTDTVPLRDGQARKRFSDMVMARSGNRFQHLHVKMDWFCARVDQAERVQGGDPRLVKGEAQSMMAQHLIDPLIVDFKPTWLLAPGGTGKSWIGTAVCVCLAAGIPFAKMECQHAETLYLDWEDDEAVFRERLYMLSRGLGVPNQAVHYRHMVGPLRNYIRNLASYITKHEIKLVVLDSVGMAMAGYEGGFEDMALALHADLRALGCAVLALDHVSGEDVSSGNVSTKAYGSVYKMNLARLAWSLKAEEPYGPKLRIGMFNVKANWGMKRKPVGLELDFSNQEQVSLHTFDVRESPELSRALPKREQIIGVLKNGARDVEEIADESGIKKGTVRSILINGRRHGIFVLLDSGLWANQHERIPQPDAPVPW